MPPKSRNTRTALPSALFNWVVLLNFPPEGLLSRSHSEYVEGETLVNMITEDLVA